MCMFCPAEYHLIVAGHLHHLATKIISMLFMAFLKKETRMSVMGIEYEYYTLNGKEWDILEEIHGGTHKRFITIGDIKYFNIIF